MAPPVRHHLHEQLEIHGPVDQLLHLQPGAAADLLEHASPLADQDPLLTGALHQHRGQHSGARAIVDDAIDLHRHRVGHLLAGVQQHLFPHQLGHQQLLRLVAHHLRRVEVGPGRQGRRQGLHECRTAGSREGAAAMQGPFLGHELAVGGLDVVGVGAHPVALVQGHLHRGAGLAQDLHDPGIAPARRLAAVDQQQHLIHLTDGTPGALHQPLAQQVMGLVDARRVEQHQLGGGGGEDGPQAVAGGLGHRRCDRHLLAHQVVQQRGLAHVRPTDQGHEPGSERRVADSAGGGGARFHTLDNGSPPVPSP